MTFGPIYYAFFKKISVMRCNTAYSNRTVVLIVVAGVVALTNQMVRLFGRHLSTVVYVHTISIPKACYNKHPVVRPGHYIR